MKTLFFLFFSTFFIDGVQASSNKIFETFVLVQVRSISFLEGNNKRDSICITFNPVASYSSYERLRIDDAGTNYKESLFYKFTVLKMPDTGYFFTPKSMILKNESDLQYRFKKETYKSLKKYINNYILLCIDVNLSNEKFFVAKFFVDAKRVNLGILYKVMEN